MCGCRDSALNTQNRLVPALTDLLLAAYGPVAVLCEELSELGATRVAIFGSWAARYRGEPGLPPNDVDVLLVRPVDRSAADDAARRAEQRLGYAVNPTVMSEQRWAAAEWISADPLIRTIRTSPLVVLTAAGIVT